METVGAFLDEDSDFMLNLNLNGSDLFSNKVLNGLSFLANCAEENVEDSVFFPSDTLDCTTNFYYVSQESSNNSSEIDAVIFPSQENIVNNLDVRSYTRDDQSTLFSDNHNLLTDHLGDYVKEMQLKRKPETPEEKMEENSSESPKKKSRVTGDVSRNKQGMVPSKKNEKVTQTSDEEIKKTNGGGSGPSSSSCIYEDDCNGSQESLKSNAKARASRGSATDPQSLYARKRRERINERLKILQNIVPNGTKVDISTMLEEAVHYVKFLQLQIKLLSSDGTWMYAPIACNGQNIGLY